GIRGLSEAETVLWHGIEFERKISKGEVPCYSASRQWPEARPTVAALRRLGALDTAKGLEQMLDADEANDYLRVDKLCGRLRGCIEDIPRLVCAYAREHQEDLLSLRPH